MRRHAGWRETGGADEFVISKSVGRDFKDLRSHSNAWGLLSFPLSLTVGFKLAPAAMRVKVFLMGRCDRLVGARAVVCRGPAADLWRAPMARRWRDSAARELERA